MTTARTISRLIAKRRRQRRSSRTDQPHRYAERIKVLTVAETLQREIAQQKSVSKGS